MNFTKDYVVLGRLGQAYFRRSQLELQGSTAQTQFLDKAVATYQQVLAIDPEDLMAHYGLNQCYGQLGAGTLKSNDLVEGTLGEMETLLKQAVEGSPLDSTAIWKSHSASRLSDVMTELGRRPPDAKAPRIKPFQNARIRLQKAYVVEKESVVKEAYALALSAIHRELHALLKPDELARSATTREYRKNHPAANAAAEAIVIYPTDRFGPSR